MWPYYKDEQRNMCTYRFVLNVGVSALYFVACIYNVFQRFYVKHPSIKCVVVDAPYFTKFEQILCIAFDSSNSFSKPLCSSVAEQKIFHLFAAVLRDVSSIYSKLFLFSWFRRI